MRDPYLYEGTEVLKNLLNIKDEKQLETAGSNPKWMINWDV